MGKGYFRIFLLFTLLVTSCSPQSSMVQANQIPQPVISDSASGNTTNTTYHDAQAIDSENSSDPKNLILQSPTSIPPCPSPQGYTWSHFFNADTSFITKILPSGDGNFYLSGVVDNQEALWVAKMNPEGDLLWQNLYGEKYGDLQLALNGNLLIQFGLTNLEIDPDGSIVRGVDAPWYQPNADGSTTILGNGMAIHYTDPQNPLWQIKSQNPNLLSVPTTDGGAVYAYAGSYVDEEVYYKPTFTDIKVIKIDETGQVWQHVYGKLLGDETVDYLMAVPDGGALLVGTNSYDEDSSNYDIWLMKINGGGIPSWQSTLKLAPDRETLQDIKIFPSGIIATILTRSSNDPVLVRFTKKGSLVWQKQISSSRGEVSINAMADTADGGLLLSGETNELNNVAFLARLSPKGDLLWEKTFGFTDIPDAPDVFIEAILPLDNGEILLGGGTNLAGQTVMDTFSAWTAKISDSGETFDFLTLSPGNFEVSDTLASRPDTLEEDVFEATELDIQEIDFPMQDTHFEVLPACLAEGAQFPTPEALPSISPTLIPSITPTTSGQRDLFLNDPALQGDDVFLLQQRLIALGFSEIGTPDGIFGSLTENAVSKFQEINGLEGNGVVGPLTWEKLLSQEAIRK